MTAPRVLFFSTTGSPFGGVETWLDQMCTFLGRNGYDPILGLVRGMKYNDPDRFRKCRPGLNSVEIDGRGFDREGRIRALLRYILRVNPSIVLPMGVVDAYDAVIRGKTKRKELRLVAHAQGNLPPMLADLADYRRHIDHVVCPGMLTRRYLLDVVGFDPERVDHIPNGAGQATQQRQERQAGAPLRLGYVGRLTPLDKRVLDLPKLCDRLVGECIPFHLTVVGDGPCREELLRKLEPFRPQVAFLGPQSAEFLYSQVFPRLDCLLLFSASEAFGIVLAEAMMNGVVPVTSQYVGFQSERLVVHERHGLSFPIGDIKSAAEAIRGLHQSPEKLRQFSRAAKEHVSSRYTWEHCLTAWQECLMKIASRPPVMPSLASNGSKKSPSAGRLDRLGLPPSLIDLVRRARRALLGVPVPPGGEEWPMYHADHDATHLAEIQEWCEELERTAAAEVAQMPVAEMAEH